ncbi:MAG: hypothetical protein JWL64_2757 [Frankiales bacterium]|nr:hypothetical protein [Frankiales bacterium]
MAAETRAERLRRLAARRPGPWGYVLQPLVWIGLGIVVVTYLVAILALAFAAVLVATLRLFLTPPLRLLARAPGVRAVVERRRVRRYARSGVTELETRLAAPQKARAGPE